MNRLGSRIKLSAAAEKAGTSVASSARKPPEEFGNAESIVGTAGGDDSIGMNGAYSQAGSSFADRASQQQLQQQTQSRGHTANNNTSYYDDDDSALIFGDDPEKAYFEYILQQEQEQRARQGKSAEDSLLGDSTVEEIQMNSNGPWKQRGGQDSREVGPSDLEEDSYLDFPILSSAYNNGNAPPSIFGGYSLATTEKSPTVSQQPHSQQYPSTPVQETPQKAGAFFPDVIYLTDAPPTPATTSSRQSHEDYKSTSGGAGRGTCFYAIIFLLGGIALAGAAVAIYLSMATKSTSGGTSTSSSENGSFNTLPPFSITAPPLEDDDIFVPMPTPSPSLLLQKRTDAPTQGDDSTLNDDENVFTANDDDDDDLETPMPTWNPTIKPTKAPTKAPASATNQPAQNPTTPNDTIRCGCKDCAAQLWRPSDGIPCVDRIDYLKRELGYDEDAACRLVAGIEFPMACSGSLCNPDECFREPNVDSPTDTNPTPITSIPMRQPTDATQSPITRRPTLMPSTPDVTNSPVTPRPTNNPTRAPSFRPTAPEPTRRPTPRPTSLELTEAGNNGSPGDVYPLGRCEG